MDRSSEEDDLQNASDDCPMTEAPEKVILEKHIFKGMEHFLNSEKFSDIDVKVGEEVFKCHKIVLASWSAYFDALFMSGMSEIIHGVVELTAIDAEDFKDILKIMYTGNCEVHKENIQGLLFSASYLQILPLIEGCENFIKKSLLKTDASCILHYLQISHQLNLTNLVEHILDFIAIRFKTFEVCNEFFESLCVDDMKTLLGSKKLNCKSEDEICTALLCWIDVDLIGRQGYTRDLVKKIHYLALSNDYMSKIFLEHKAIKENCTMNEIRSHCLEYLSLPRQQSDYIGEPVASHRLGHRLRDAIVVFYKKSVKLFRCEEKEDGSLNYIHSTFTDGHEENLGRPEDVNEKVITACNYGRSEVIVSNGQRLLHFSGLTWVWTSGPKHLVPSSINCVVCNQRSGDIYSVVVDTDIVFIEKCKFDSENGFGELEMEMQQEIENSSYHYDRKYNDRNEIYQENGRTCAYMVDENIFFIKTGVAPESERATVFKYNTESKTIGIVNILPLKYQFATAVTHKGLVFLVDRKNKTIIRISEGGHCFEKYGQIGMYVQDKEFNDIKNSSACILNGKLIKTGGRIPHICGHLSMPCILEYDLCQHVSKVHHLESFCHNMRVENDAVCLKLTMQPLG